MSNPRKKIILNEIHFWRESKLLPEHYCDFLATLYTEGQYDDQEEVSHKQAILAIEKRKSFLQFFGLLIASFAVLFVLFTFNTLVIFLSVVVIFLALFLIISAFKIAKNKSFLAPLQHILAALLVLGVSLKVSITYFEGNNLILYGILAGNCVMWLLSGVKLKLGYFIVSGVAGLVVLIGFYIFYLL